MKRTIKLFAALRKAKDNGHVWLDVCTVSSLPKAAKSKADNMDDKEGYVSNWAYNNPQFKIVEFTATYDEQQERDKK